MRSLGVVAVAAVLLGIGAGTSGAAPQDGPPAAGEAEQHQGPLAIGDRGARTKLARTGGGGSKTEKAVDLALTWLAKHQAKDGRWSGTDFPKECSGKACDGVAAEKDWDVGMTGLALLAFSGAGVTPKGGKNFQAVDAGVKFLLDQQTDDGCYGPKSGQGHWVYSHAIATYAMADLLAQGDDSGLRTSVTKAVDLLLKMQNPNLGWRYGIRPGDNDTSITAWCFCALKAARLARIEVPEIAFEGALNWLHKVTARGKWKKTGYSQRGDNGARMPAAQMYKPTEAMTAAAVTCRLFGGADPKDEFVAGGCKLLLMLPPKWTPGQQTDLYYWYYGSLALFQVGGEDWKQWNRALVKALTPNQCKRGHARGSWDPACAWGVSAGRVYSTAMAALCLETYYRYPQAK